MTTEMGSEFADASGACLVADVANYAGLLAGGLYPNPLLPASAVALGNMADEPHG